MMSWKYASNSSQFTKMLYSIFPLTNHLVLQNFSKGVGTPWWSGFIVKNNCIYSSFLSELIEKWAGISVNRNPIVDGMHVNACSMMRAKEWQTHFNWTHPGETSFILDQTLLFFPLTLLAPSEENPTTSLMKRIFFNFFKIWKPLTNVLKEF